jgi:hypothetical protein
MVDLSARVPVTITPVRECRIILIDNFLTIGFFFLGERALCQRA